MLQFLFILFIIYELISKLMGDDQQQQKSREYSYGRQSYYKSASDAFLEAQLVLIAVMMKADGHARRIELDYVKRVLLNSLGETRAKAALLKLKDLLKKDINIGQATTAIRYNVNYRTRLELTYLLYGIAKADGVITQNERELVYKIAYAIGITMADIESIFSTYYDFSGDSGNSQSALDAAYKILEIEPTSNDDEVKKAYRNMAKKYHPDTVADLGEAAQKNAEVKFRKVQEAYEKIKNARGMK